MPRYDLGRKDHFDTAVPRSSKNKIRYPDLYINNIELPITAKDVGKVINANVRLKIRSASVNIDMVKKKKTQDTAFDVLSIEMYPNKKLNMKDMSKETLDQLEKEEYDRIGK